MHGKFVGLLAQRPWLRLVAWNLAVTVTYVLAGLLSFVFGLPPAYISPVYPPSGIAVAAFLILGPPVLPGIWLANVLSSAVIFTEGSLTPATAAVTMAGGFGAVGEALVAGWVMQRFTGARHPFEHPRHVVAFQLGAALLAGAVGAALGTFSIWAAGFVSTPDVWHTAVVWWLGDAAGIAIFAPLILAWWRGDDRLERVDLARSVPLIVAATLIVAAAEFVSGLTVEYLYLPVVLWGAFRNGPRGATLAAALVSVMTVLLTAHRLGSSSGHSTTDALMLLESFVAVITSTGLIVCAIRARQETAEAALAEHNRTLEQRVAERTAELALKNRLLGEKQDRIDADLGTALALQAGILPSDFARFTSVRIAAAARPALEMSGDFYDVFHVAEGRLAVVIADVSGKGVAAAFFMAMARTLVRTIAARRDTPAALIAAVNDEILSREPAHHVRDAVLCGDGRGHGRVGLRERRPLPPGASQGWGGHGHAIDWGHGLGHHVRRRVPGAADRASARRRDLRLHGWRDRGSRYGRASLRGRKARTSLGRPCCRGAGGERVCKPGSLQRRCAAGRRHYLSDDLPTGVRRCSAV